MKPIKTSRSIDDRILRKAAVSLQRRLLQWYHKNQRQLPWRDHWQQFGSPYHVWVSEIMLQQTVIKAVLPAYERFIKRFPCIEELAASDEEEVRLASRGLGYYRRFRMLHQAARELVANNQTLGLNSSQSEFWPQDFKAWKKLSGIGNYTGAAIASIAFNEAVPVVDGNVERVFCRLLDIREEPNQTYLKKAFFDLGLELISPTEPGNFNQALMELGQLVCTKSSPLCSLCPVQKSCMAFARDSQKHAPKTKSRPVTTEIHGLLLIAEYQGKIGIIQRPATARFLAGHLGFLTGFVDDQEKIAWDGHKPLSFSKAAAKMGQKIGVIKHTITRFKITMDVRVFHPTDRLKFEWLAPEEVEARLVANLDRKAWHILEQASFDNTPLFGEKKKRLEVSDHQSLRI